MALNPSVTEEQFTGLNEVLQAEYIKQDDGSYLLDVPQNEAGFGMGNIKNLLSSKKAETQARKDLEKKFKPFDGMDASVAQGAIEFQNNYDANNVDAQEEANKKTDLANKQWQEKWNEREEEHSSEMKSILGDLSVQTIDNVIKTKLGPLVNDPSDIDILLLHFKERMSLTKGDDGKRRTIYLDGSGDEILMTDTSKDAGWNTLVKEMRGKFAKNFASQTPSGSGSGGAGGNGSGNVLPKGKIITSEENKALHPKDRNEFMAAGGKVVDD